MSGWLWLSLRFLSKNRGEERNVCFPGLLTLALEPYVLRAPISAILSLPKRESLGIIPEPLSCPPGQCLASVGEATGYPRPLPQPSRWALRPALHPSIWSDIYQCQSLAAKAIFINQVSKLVTKFVQRNRWVGVAVCHLGYLYGEGEGAWHSVGRGWDTGAGDLSWLLPPLLLRLIPGGPTA